MSQSLVGIIANPASGRDIRRLVAQGTVFDNNEKAAIVRRILLGLAAMGVTRVAYMPEHDFGIVLRAANEHREIDAEELPLPVTGTSIDSTRAAQLLAERGASCIITLGGDGTNRAIAKGCSSVPLIPISTGTNNVFPTFLEGTLAGMAAGLIATGRADAHSMHRVPWLEVLVDNAVRDYALIDVVISTQPFIGSRALWDLSTVQEIVLSRVVPTTIGISALGGALLDHADTVRPGMHISLGDGEHQVLAALAPGLVRWIHVRSYQRLAVDDGVPFQFGTGTVALDGEREIELKPHSRVSVHLRADGPYVVDVATVLADAAQSKYFYRSNHHPHVE
jgi:predicted polyphosphate/ATP-dependent NAD kinase